MRDPPEFKKMFLVSFISRSQVQKLGFKNAIVENLHVNNHKHSRRALILVKYSKVHHLYVLY